NHGLKDGTSSAPSHIHFRIKTKGGKIRWIGHVCQPVYNEQGKYNGIRTSNRDITDLRNSQRSLDEHRDMLMYFDRKETLGQLTGSIAHELNQPLTGILSDAQAGELLLKREGMDKGIIEEIFTDIVADTKRASQIIRNLHELFSNKKVEFDPIDINTLTMDTLQILNSEIIAHSVFIKTNLSTKLPNVNGNRIQLQQLLINLIKNSIQAMQHVKETGRWVSINTTLDNDDQVMLCLEDNGPGIDPDQLEEIFEPLSTTKQDGMGMGLAISKSIVQAHAGRIWAQNSPQGGACFNFTLPSVEVLS
ncbi:MAG: ATP-binding protein, partial [Desulfuromonadales bacterium]